MDQASPRPDPIPNLAEVPTDALGDQVTQLAAHLDAATCTWLLLVAELDRREAWAEWGCRSMAHWLNWKAGVAMVSAREQVRVARRLGELALVRAAFATGELSYSKVRAIARVATPENEAALVELARGGTAAHLESVVRAYRRASGELGKANARHARRHVRWYYDDDGCMVISARLSPEDGAVVVAALRAAEEAVSEEAVSEQANDGGDAAASPDSPEPDSPEPEAAEPDSPAPEAAETCTAVAGGAPTGSSSWHREEPDTAVSPSPSTGTDPEWVTGYADQADQTTGPDDAAASSWGPGPTVGANHGPQPVGPGAGASPDQDTEEPWDPWGARQADALVRVAEAALASKWASRPGAERTQLVLHMGVDALTTDDPDA